RALRGRGPGHLLRRMGRPVSEDPLAAPRTHPWDRLGPEAFAQLPVLVAGWGASGRSAAAVLGELGARVSVLEQNPHADLHGVPAAVRMIADDDPHRLAERAAAVGARLLIASPGWSPAHPVLRSLAAAGVPIWREVELAWHIGDPATHWLTLTGTNGKTTTVGMLAAILAAADRNAPAVGNVGVPIAETVLGARGADRPLEALAVELSSFQLHYTSS